MFESYSADVLLNNKQTYQKTTWHGKCLKVGVTHIHWDINYKVKNIMSIYTYIWFTIKIQLSIKYSQHRYHFVSSIKAGAVPKTHAALSRH